jgi:hypothetical protein
MQLLPSQLKLPATFDRLLLLLLLPLMLTLLLVQLLLAGDMQLADPLHCRNLLLVSSRCSSSDSGLLCSSCMSNSCLCCNFGVGRHRNALWSLLAWRFISASCTRSGCTSHTCSTNKEVPQQQP